MFEIWAEVGMKDCCLCFVFSTAEVYKERRCIPHRLLGLPATHKAWGPAAPFWNSGTCLQMNRHWDMYIHHACLRTFYLTGVGTRQKQHVKVKGKGTPVSRLDLYLYTIRGGFACSKAHTVISTRWIPFLMQAQMKAYRKYEQKRLNKPSCRWTKLVKTSRTMYCPWICWSSIALRIY